MPLYFFDTRDGDDFFVDLDGVEMANLEAATIVAAVSLAEMARDIIPGSLKRVLTVEVRDDREPVMKAHLIFEAVILAK